jgi:hypothetical protein
MRSIYDGTSDETKCTFIMSCPAVSPHLHPQVSSSSLSLALSLNPGLTPPRQHHVAKIVCAQLLHLTSNQFLLFQLQLLHPPLVMMDRQRGRWELQSPSDHDIRATMQSLIVSTDRKIWLKLQCLVPFD